ncbi:virion structural protein [Xanthomonas phage RTH11]|nr:virion structural protein [Xanthomonas phage RTH11]
MTIIVYPRLYTSRLPGGEGVQVSQGDESIELLYKVLVDRNTNTRAWPFQASVLENAMRLFGDFREWAQEQLSNPNVIGYNRQFIQDTFNFIENGQRELSVQTWLDLVSEGGAGHHAHAIPQRLLDTKLLLQSSQSSLELIQKWVSQRNGLEDLLNTMHLLFGRACKS